MSAGPLSSARRRGKDSESGHKAVLIRTAFIILLIRGSRSLTWPRINQQLGHKFNSHPSAVRQTAQDWGVSMQDRKGLNGTGHESETASWSRVQVLNLYTHLEGKLDLEHGFELGDRGSNLWHASQNCRNRG